MKQVILNGKYGSVIGNYAIVDDEDFNKLSQYKWSCTKYKLKYRTIYYARSNIGNGNIIFMHRFITCVDKNHVIDHKNHNTLDNRKENLRSCTRQENSMNSSARTLSEYKGVSERKGLFYARICSNRKSTHIGVYKTAKEAALAYDKKALELFGEFANLNFPEQHHAQIKIEVNCRSNSKYKNIYYNKTTKEFIPHKTINKKKFSKRCKTLQEAQEYLKTLD